MASANYQKKSSSDARAQHQPANPFVKSILTTKVALSITEIGRNVKQNLEKKIARMVENRCIVEGFIKPNSVNVMTYSSGIVVSDYIDFVVMYECMIASPVEGMVIETTVKTITKAGIHSQVIDESGTVPITAFIARDHHYSNQQFFSVKEGDRILIKVIGSRYELHDPYICVIATLEQESDGVVAKGSKRETKGSKRETKARIRVIEDAPDDAADSVDAEA
jgi:DNA-directed RNA polymerase subunit E'/Rpb7